MSKEELRDILSELKETRLARIKLMLENEVLENEDGTYKMSDLAEEGHWMMEKLVEFNKLGHELMDLYDSVAKGWPFVMDEQAQKLQKLLEEINE